MGKSIDIFINNLFEGVNDDFNKTHLDEFNKQIDGLIRDRIFGFWLYKKNGLGLQKTIESRLQQSENHKSVADQKVLSNTFDGIELLYNNKHEKTKEYIKKDGDTFFLKNRWGQENFFIKNNGDGTFTTNFEFYHDNENNWHQVNKLNTNYSDINRLLKYIINDNYSEMVFITIKNNEQLKKFLIQNIEKIKDIILNISDEKIISFIEFSTKTSEIGEISEKNVVTKLKEEWGDDNVIWSGGNGDILDMILGIDIIVLKDGKVNTVQVKTTLSKDITEEMKRYPYIDFFAGKRDGVITIVKRLTDVDKKELNDDFLNTIKNYKGENDFLKKLSDFANSKGYLSPKQTTIAKNILNTK